MIAKVYSAIPQGYNGRLVEVEGDSNRGLPAFNIVGMANKTISEARERVRSALTNSGFSFPQCKVTISLAPAELAKDGSHLDLPIAIAVLILSQQLLASDVEGRAFVGELALDGFLRPVRGIINIVEAAKQAGYTEIYLPRDNLARAQLINGIKIIGVNHLRELFLHLKGQCRISNHQNVVENTATDYKNDSPLFDHIYGQEFAKRALTIAVAGHHNILLKGPPGTGKSLLAQAALHLLPDPSPIEQIAIAKLHSLSEAPSTTFTRRPFRAPHHTASPTSIIGGGARITPGEISLAHSGILFLDELPEYPRNVLEALRQPLENKTITISRAHQHITYPADFMLIATMNPCPCGYFGDIKHSCTCTQTQIQNYQKRLSGPIQDRIDMVVNVPRLEIEQFAELRANPTVVKNTQTDLSHQFTHSVVKNKITLAAQRQAERYEPGIFNSSLSSAEVTDKIKLSPAAQNLLLQATERFNLSPRAYFKIIKVAQTIADLDGITGVNIEQISEALTFRES